MRKARVIPLNSYETATPAPQRCEKEGCDAKGEFRAPKNPNALQEYYWFCLDHVREYNKGWDFYKGMNREEIDASRISDVTWNRPSWPLGSWRTLLEKVHFCDGLESFFEGAAPPPPPLPQRVKKALSILNVSSLLTLEEIKKQYKQLVKRHHPDLHAGDKQAEENLKKINEAYQVVKKHLEGERPLS